MPTPDELFAALPPEEQAARRKVGQAMVDFVTKLAEMRVPGEPWDRPMLRHWREIYREEVEEAAAQGVENALVWHTLGTWTEEGRERVGYFARALECEESGQMARLRVPGPETEWSALRMRADCLYEIGRVHLAEGDARVAKDFLTRSARLAVQAEWLKNPMKVKDEKELFRRISGLLYEATEKVHDLEDLEELQAELEREEEG